ncbi:MAG: GAF and ANTAR domain-containing protein [Actinomycetota bacterium]|nr:GAF and ANTAR domain-containing protein [Actinomycetota bacterium]
MNATSGTTDPGGTRGTRETGPGGEAATREALIIDTFVTLADTLVDDYDVVGILDMLVRRCVELLPVAAAGILLDDQAGHLAVMASSSEETRLLEIFQLQNAQGPCLDSIHSGSVVVSSDLEADVDRWPAFAPAALSSGIRAVTALPLRLRATVIGGLNLFLTDTVFLTQAEVRLAQALADVACIGILEWRSTDETRRVAEQLQRALDSPVAIEQAKGILLERHGLTMQAAFDALRLHARNHNAKLTEVAQSVIRGELDTPSTPLVR